MNIVAFDLNLLVVFEALLAERSVTRAARRVGLSQPAFSNALGRLRAAVGEPLFERTGGGMVPTPRAQAMALPVRAALADVQRALASSAESPAPPPIVTIAANEYARCLMLPLVMRALNKTAPAVRLDICDVASTAAGQAEFSIDWAAEGRPDGQAIILRDVMVGIAARGNRQVRGATAGVMLDPRREIVVSGMERHLAALGRDERQAVPDMLTAVCLVSETDGVAGIPDRLARRFAKTMALKVFKLAHPGPGLVLELNSRANTVTDPVAVAVKKCVVGAAKRLAGGRAE